MYEIALFKVTVTLLIHSLLYTYITSFSNIIRQTALICFISALTADIFNFLNTQCLIKKRNYREHKIKKKHEKTMIETYTPIHKLV